MVSFESVVLLPFFKEIFKQVLGYNNYLVSNYGRVYSKTRKKFLVAVKDKKGYMYVNLSEGSITKTCKIHRLVAEAFLGRYLRPDEDVHHLIRKDDKNKVVVTKEQEPKEESEEVIIDVSPVEEVNIDPEVVDVTENEISQEEIVEEPKEESNE